MGVVPRLQHVIDDVLRQLGWQESQCRAHEGQRHHGGEPTSIGQHVGQDPFEGVPFLDAEGADPVLLGQESVTLGTPNPVHLGGKREGLALQKLPNAFRHLRELGLQRIGVGHAQRLAGLALDLETSRTDQLLGPGLLDLLDGHLNGAVGLTLGNHQQAPIRHHHPFTPERPVLIEV